MSARKVTSLVFAVLLITSMVLAYAPQTTAQGHYSHNSGADGWILTPTTSKTTGQTTVVTITTKGLPSDFSTVISVDSKEMGSMTGEQSRAFDVDKAVPHVFSADAQITGSCSTYEGKSVCTRYRCADHHWAVEVVKTQTCQTVPICVRVGLRFVCTSEQQCQTTTDLKEKTHTFEYLVEHELAIDDAHGQNVDRWYRDGSDVSVSAEESVVTKDRNNLRERDIFQDWVLNGARIESRTLALKMDKPYYARAEYRTETQYKVRVASEFGNPSLDNPTGWYLKGQEATVSVENEVPAEGWLGAFGGRTLFVAWHNLRGIQSKTPKFTFTVEEPMILQAEWKTDYSQPMAIIMVAVVLLVAAIVFTLYKSGRLPKRARLTEENQTAKSKAQP